MPKRDEWHDPPLGVNWPSSTHPVKNRSTEQKAQNFNHHHHHHQKTRLTKSWIGIPRSQGASTNSPSLIVTIEILLLDVDVDVDVDVDKAADKDEAIQIKIGKMEKIL
jgi:hypothetical protein